MHRVRTAVIPVAGLGTRLLPASKAIPKEMVPVVDKPLIQYVVEEAVAAGIKRIVLVTRSGKEAIENHFDRNFELETELERKDKHSLLRTVRNTLPADVEIVSVRQQRAAGLGDAIHCAAVAVGNEPFAVLLPDVLVHTRVNAGWNLKFMISRYEQAMAAQILVEEVSPEVVDQYGIVDCGRRKLCVGDSARLFGMVEKPARREAPSRLAIVGRYVLPPMVLELLKNTGVGAGGEIQLTDALHSLLEKSPIEALMMRGRTFDCGNKAGLAEANLAFGLEDEEIGERMRQLVTETSRILEDQAARESRAGASLSEVA
jgi:UTP--glucose-1-phosphate uridylyltransferase